jgi:polyisoprenoid-binding protein YceI
MSTRSGNIDVIIDTASINTGLDKRDDHLRGEDFFNVAQFPTMRSSAGKLASNGDKLTSAQGELTMPGVTRPVMLNFDSFVCGAHPMNKRMMCGTNATAAIRRSEWGLKTYIPTLGDEVKIAIQVKAFKD